MFSCEIFEIFKNTYFEEYLRVTASVDSFSFSMFIIYVIDLSTKNKVQRRGFIFLQKSKIMTVGNRKEKFFFS